MRGATDWIPTQNDDIYNKLKSYLELIVANKVAWGIADIAITPLTDLQAEFNPLYDKIQDKRRRTSADVTDFRDCKKRLLDEWRAFHKENVRGNRKISPGDLSILVGKEYDTEPTPRAKIELTPYVNLKPIASGVIEVRSQTEKDATRVSMLKTADGIECRYTIVPKGEMPPSSYEDAKSTVVSRKARFTITVGDKNSGDSFYGFFRWVNTSRSDNSGPWTKAIHAVIA